MMTDIITEQCRKLFVVAKSKENLVVARQKEPVVVAEDEEASKNYVEKIKKLEVDWIYLYGCFLSGKTTLIRRYLMSHLMSPPLPVEPTPEEEWPPEPWPNIPFHSIDAIDENTKTSPTPEYLGQDELIEQLILRLQPGPQTTETWPPQRNRFKDLFIKAMNVISEFRSLEKKDLPKFLDDQVRELDDEFIEDRKEELGRLLLTYKSVPRPVLLFQGAFKDLKFENLIVDLLNGAIEKAEPEIRKNQMALEIQRPLVIFEYWRWRTREEIEPGPVAASEQRKSFSMINGWPPSEKPSVRQALQHRAREAISLDKSLEILPKGLKKNVAIHILKNVLKTVIKRSADDYACLSEAAYFYCGGHLGCMVLVLDALRRGYDRDDDIRERLEQSVDIKVLMGVVEDCIFEANVGNRLRRTVDQLWRSTNAPLQNPARDRETRNWLLNQQLILSSPDGGTEQWIRIISLLIGKEGGKDPMEPTSLTIVSAVAAQLALWLSPAVMNASSKVGEVLGEELANKIRNLFNQESLPANGDAAASPELATSLETKAANKLKDAHVNPEMLVRETQRTLIKLLRDDQYFSDDDLNAFWQDYSGGKRSYTSLKREFPSPISIADELVREATRQGNLAKLIETMRPTMRKHLGAS